jgi:hypothetical protein
VVRLLNASAACSTWRKHNAAVNCFRNFEKKKGVKYAWPMGRDTICEFVVYCISDRHLKPSTVQSYLSSMAFVFKLNDWDPSICNDFLVKQMLKGATNLSFYNDLSKAARKVMTLPLLKILSHQIAKSKLSKWDKQVVWTACSVAFFGSFRFGELLAKNDHVFNEFETLLWSDVLFKPDSIVIKIKIPKSRSSQGEYVDLFYLNVQNLCPVNAMLKLRNLVDVSVSNVPVFKMENNSYLTSNKLNKLLSDFLVPVIGPAGYQITGHSFRAALPSSLANCPEIASDEDIRRWGRWNSSSYNVYTRLKPRQKKIIFEKIMLSLEYMKI